MFFGPLEDLFECKLELSFFVGALCLQYSFVGAKHFRVWIFMQ